MPWQETNSVLERHQFTQDLASGHWLMTELCDRCGISRTTGYKWLHRYEPEGVPGLLDRSRAPRACPAETPPPRRRRAHSRGAHALRLGRAEDLEAPAHARSEAHLARQEYDLRHSRAA
jgi:hypothetical protein